MRKFGEIETVVCKGCQVEIKVLKCRQQKFCSQKCCQSFNRKRAKSWKWSKNVMEQKKRFEEKDKETSAHRSTIFTGGHSDDDVLWGYSEGEIL
jgi:hypothetical protein